MQIFSKAHKKNVNFNCHFDNRTYGNGVQDWVAKYGYSTIADSSIGPYQGHGGIDVGGGENAPIYAVNAGVVELAGPNGKAGNEVRIWTGSQMHRYLHLNSISVANGAQIQEGQQIGTEGGTGGYPVHLHFEVWGSKNQGDKLDPFNIIQQGGSGGSGSAGGMVEELAFVTDLSKWDKNSTKLGIYTGGLVKVNQSTPMYADQAATQRIRITRIDGQVMDAEADHDEQVKPLYIYKNAFVSDITDQLGCLRNAWVLF